MERDCRIVFIESLLTRIIRTNEKQKVDSAVLHADDGKPRKAVLINWKFCSSSSRRIQNDLFQNFAQFKHNPELCWKFCAIGQAVQFEGIWKNKPWQLLYIFLLLNSYIFFCFSVKWNFLNSKQRAPPPRWWMQRVGDMLQNRVCMVRIGCAFSLFRLKNSFEDVFLLATEMPLFTANISHRKS